MFKRRSAPTQALTLLAAAAAAACQWAAAAQNTSCLGEALAAMGFLQGELHDALRPEHDPADCRDKARALTPEPEFLAALRPRSRSIPPRAPPLAAFDWDARMTAVRPPAWPNIPAQDFEEVVFQGVPLKVSHPEVGMCIAHRDWELLRLKIYNGVLYAHFPHNDKTVVSRHGWWGSREAVYEQLLTLMWLYKDLPDMDLAVNYHDNPLPCNLSLPVLQFTVVNRTSPATGSTMDIEPQNYACSGHLPSAHSSCIGYTRGYTMPHLDGLNLAMSEKQLWGYAACLHLGYMSSLAQRRPAEACAVPRKPLAFWRGTSTGYMRGWSAQQNARWAHKFSRHDRRASFLQGMLLNKRVRLALMAEAWPWMDVGLTDIFDWYFPGYQDHSENRFITAVLRDATYAEQVPMQGAKGYHLMLNLDGAGPAYRLLNLLLGNVPIVKVESILREWFIEAAVPGVHYIPARYDLSDIGEVTRTRLLEAQRDSSTLERIALNAAVLAVKKGNLFAQQDALAWSVARIKEACPWTVRPPKAAVSVREGADMFHAEDGWHVVKYGHTWFSALPEDIKAAMTRDMPHNFEARGPAPQR